MKILFIVFVMSAISQSVSAEGSELARKWIQSESVSLKKELLSFQERAKQSCVVTNIKTQTQLEVFKKKVKGDFLSLFNQWQRFSVLSLKPTQENRYKISFQFFPDKKGRVKKKLNSYLELQDLVDLGFVQKAPFYSTGLSALEILLFDKDERFLKRALANVPNYCSLLVNISLHLQIKQQEFTKEVVDYFENTNVESFEADLLNTILFSLEEIKKSKLERPVNIEVAKVFQKRFESFRSQNSLDNLKNNFTAQKELIEIVFVPMLKKENLNDLANEVLKEYGEILVVLESFTAPLSEMDLESSDYKKYEELLIKTKRLISMLKRQVAPALKIALQFNGADGD